MRLFGLIGYPLGHSFSEKYFKEKFTKEGISNAEYKLFPIENITEFESLYSNNSNLSGINVTIPYKKQIIPYLDALSPEAEKIGAVNVVKFFREGDSIRKVGFNTDIHGFRDSLRNYISPKTQKALILGTGGAARAVAYGLQGLAIDYKFVSRSPEFEEDISYADLSKDIIQKHTLIINTTPLGTFPNENTYPDISYQHLTSEHILFDLVYNPPETLFMLFGKQNGATVVNGYEMLTIQAERAWNIWNQ